MASRAGLLLLLAALTGCGGSMVQSIAPADPVSPGGPTTTSSPAVSGRVQEGQQPVVGASIALYAAGTTGYASPSTNLLSAQVVTDSSGNFTLAQPSTCTAGQQLYLVATGGNAGPGTNPNSALMAGLGDCASLTSTRFTLLDEVTTVASVYALAPFMSGAASLGAPASNLQGLARAFSSINKLVNTTTGVAPGTALPSGAVAPSTQLYALADILAACIDSTGGHAGDGTPCGRLFTLTATSASTPADTIAATLAIARNPTANVAALYALAPTSMPFLPTLTSAPTDWALAITYHAGGFNSPTSTAVDASGNIWVANSAGNSVSVLAQTGVPIAGSPFSGNGLAAPTSIALDASGNAWVANSGGSTVSVFQNDGSVWSGSPFAVGAAPSAVAVDLTGDIWVANASSNSLTQLSSSGAPLRTITSNVSSPSALAVDPN
jgi:streptogramin lyase